MKTASEERSSCCSKKATCAVSWSSDRGSPASAMHSTSLHALKLQKLASVQI